jgi:methylthioribose-1-phosphate isomerase
MRLEKRKLSGREKDEEAIKLLEQLREKLYVDDISAARRAAFNLSWKQEDGLDILKEALFNNSPRTAKIAAVYGLRNMQGRMKKIAFNVLEEGLKQRKADIRNACNHALSLVGLGKREKSSSERPPKSGRFEIRDVPRKSMSGGKIRTRGMHEPNRRSRR